MTPPPDRSPSLFGQTVAALAGAVVPGLAPSAKRLVVSAETELARTRSVALAAAAQQADMTREELQDAIAANPRLVPLLQRLLYAAGMTGYDPLLAAMGVALGRAAQDPEVHDESAMLLDSLNGLTAAHVQVLRLLTEAPEEPSRDPLAQELQAGAREHYGWARGQLHVRANLPAHVVDLAVAALVSRSMVNDRGYRGNVTMTVTPLGGMVLELLEAHHAAEGC